jgi:flavin reductase (DIM6/NTAB) family NADH-FMN oxidoreductase RutF
MARKRLKEGALLAPVPPVLVSVGDSTESNIITVAWTGILATHPPRTYVSVRPSRHSYAILKRTGEFVINLAPARLAREVDFCGIYTGAKVDKFARCGFTKEESCEVEAPTIKECPLAIECKVAEVIPMGTHDVFVADIVSISCDEEMLDSDGSLRFDKAELLAYAHGEYFGLGASLGKFGFSTKKDVKGGGVSRKTLQAKSEKEEKEGESKRPFYMDIAKKGSRAKAPDRKSKRTVRK